MYIVKYIKKLWEDKDYLLSKDKVTSRYGFRYMPKGNMLVLDTDILLIYTNKTVHYSVINMKLDVVQEN